LKNRMMTLDRRSTTCSKPEKIMNIARFEPCRKNA
jgi:hypothetical protein